MDKPPDVVVHLKTLDMRAISTQQRAHQKRVFSEDEWKYLNALPTKDLWRRVRQGEFLVQLLHVPAMLNMTQKEADYRASNLHFQMDEIMEIIKNRKEGVSNGRG